jgi:CDP-glycerol glycerophosphotransferase (TagB/SpsB family)
MLKKAIKLLKENPHLFAYKVLKKISEPTGKKLYRVNTLDRQTLDDAEIVVYFYGMMGQTYQIKQWIDTFRELNKKHKLVVAIREFDVYRYWSKTLEFDLWYCNTLTDLMDFYDRVDPKLILYINNGMKNYHSLLYEKAMHVFINHGESDKSSDHSNQIKSYDYNFVHGPNGYNNYMKYLINLDPKTLIQTGRPQLDFVRPVSLDTHGRPVIAYVTTYEATHRSMRYTSVDVYGEKIVDQILKSDRYFFIYKPHPNLGGNDPKVREIHQRIVRKVQADPNAVMLDDVDVNNIYPLVDFAIFDMSSTMTDFLNVDKPFVLADVFNPEVHDVEGYNILKGCNRITHENIDRLLEVIEDEMQNDPMKEARREVKKLYLGEYAPGESLRTFIDSITTIISKRDDAIKTRTNTPFASRYPTLLHRQAKRAYGSYSIDPEYQIVPADESIAVYFYGGLGSLWDLYKFLDLFARIHPSLPIHIVVRDEKVFGYLQHNTPLPVTFCYTIDDLLTFYEESDFKAVLYVNDGFKNFQSLIYHRALHAYLDFGRNFNAVSAARQAKGFDFVFVEHEMQKEAYLRHLIDMEPERIEIIGDPLRTDDDTAYDLLLTQLESITKKRDALLEEKGMLDVIH